MEYRFCSDLQWPTLSWQIVEMHKMVPQEWFERTWHCQLLRNVLAAAPYQSGNDNAPTVAHNYFYVFH
jgi:hypothetical protein